MHRLTALQPLKSSESPTGWLLHRKVVRAMVTCPKKETLQWQNQTNVPNCPKLSVTVVRSADGFFCTATCSPMRCPMGSYSHGSQHRFMLKRAIAIVCKLPTIGLQVKGCCGYSTEIVTSMIDDTLYLRNWNSVRWLKGINLLLLPNQCDRARPAHLEPTVTGHATICSSNR